MTLAVIGATGQLGRLTLNALLFGLNANLRDGLLGTVTDDLATLIGRPSTPMAETVKEWV